MAAKSNMEQNLDKIFNIKGADALVEILNEDKNQEVLPPQTNTPLPDKEIGEDYSYARQNLKMIIDQGAGALDSLIGIAQISQHPRAFEVIGQLIKILVESNKDLLDLKKQSNELSGMIVGENKSDGNAKTVTNALFVGSTKELQQMIKNGSVPTDQPPEDSN